MGPSFPPASVSVAPTAQIYYPEAAAVPHWGGAWQRNCSMTHGVYRCVEHGPFGG